MTWLLWRQHRSQALFSAIAFAAFGILLWITGVHFADTYRAALATCTPTDTCDQLSLFRGDGAVIDIVNLSAAVPLLMGLFWGVPSVGGEYDSGTHLLVWMQGVRRRDWLNGKIAVLLTAAALWGTAIAATVTWWSTTLNSLEANRFDPGKFDAQGIVPVAYAVFGVSLGLAAGAVIRRVLPALAVTVAGFVAIRLIVISYVRPHYETAVTSIQGLARQTTLPSGSWVLSRSLTLHGHPVSGLISPPAQCFAGSDRKASDACLVRAGYHAVTSYQPASRYWTFQWIEAGIFVGLAAALVAVAVIAVRRRDA
jgi:hypothetical protein